MRGALAYALLLAGCASIGTSKPADVIAKDGQPALYVTCSKSLLNCHAAARERCGSYLPLEDRRSLRVDSDSIGAYSVAQFELTFRCK